MQRNRGRRAAAAAHGAACANAAGHLHCQGRRDTAVWVTDVVTTFSIAVDANVLV